jgi:hypothetical protein
MNRTLVMIIGMIAAFAQQGYTQNASSLGANSTATIVSAIKIEVLPGDNSDLKFGTIIAHTTQNGTVTVSPAGQRTISTGYLTAIGSTHASAQFKVTGQPNVSISVMLPSNPVTITSAGGQTMTVDEFSADAGAGVALNDSGSKTVNVGGKLHVGAGQASANYTGTFSVTFSY